MGILRIWHALTSPHLSSKNYDVAAASVSSSQDLEFGVAYLKFGRKWVDDVPLSVEKSVGNF